MKVVKFMMDLFMKTEKKNYMKNMYNCVVCFCKIGFNNIFFIRVYYICIYLSGIKVGFIFSLSLVW